MTDKDKPKKTLSEEEKKRKSEYNKQYHKHRWATDPAYRKRKRCNAAKRYANPEVAEKQNEQLRERYANDPEFREQAKQRSKEQKDKIQADPNLLAEHNKQQAACRRERRKSDPAWREEQNRKTREWRDADPAWREEQNRKGRERWQNDPEYRERQKRLSRERSLQRRQDPVLNAEDNKRALESYHEKMKDPEYAAERKRKSREAHERRMADPVWRADENRRKRERHHERCRTDPQYRITMRLTANLRKHAPALAKRDGGWHCSVVWPDTGECGVKLDPYSNDPDLGELTYTGLEAWGLPEQGEAWHVDHKIPKSRPDVYEVVSGDTDVHRLENLQLACAPCNLRKSDRLLPAYVPAEIIELMADPDNDDKPQDFDQPPLFDQGTEL